MKKWVNKIFPSSAFAIYVAYFLKPFVIKTILKIRNIKDKMSFYSGEIFFMRFIYDFFFILALSFVKYDSSEMNLLEIVFLMSPVLIG